MTWNGYDQTLGRQGDDVGGQSGEFVPVPRGTHTTQTWNAYPLHPGVNDNPEPQGWANGLRPSAARIGNKLLLTVVPSGDNQPGHLGSGFGTVGQDSITGSYVIDQNGRRQDLAAGPGDRLRRALPGGVPGPGRGVRDDPHHREGRGGRLGHRDDHPRLPGQVLASGSPGRAL